MFDSKKPVFARTKKTIPSNAIIFDYYYSNFALLELNKIIDNWYLLVVSTVELDFSGRQNKRQLDFKRQNENDRFFM